MHLVDSRTGLDLRTELSNFSGNGFLEIICTFYTLGTLVLINFFVGHEAGMHVHQFIRLLKYTSSTKLFCT